MTTGRTFWRTLLGCPRTLIIVLILISFCGIAGGQSTLYIDDNAVRGGDGASWGTAMNKLQTALNAAAAPRSGVTELHVAQGRYVPTHRTDRKDPRSATFRLLNGVALKGGYAGLGARNPDERDPEAFPSVLSGDINGDDQPEFVNISENVYHVLIGSGTNASAVVDGFTITGGNANTGEFPVTSCFGGGALNVGGSPSFIDCVFTANWADYGGGMYNRDASSPTITGCTFLGNIAIFDLGGIGGAIRNYGSSSPIISYCEFIENSSDAGGAIAYRLSSEPNVSHCAFVANTAGAGGAIFVHPDNPPLYSTIDECLFIDNTALAGAGAALLYSTINSVVTKCTFKNNSTDYAGGGLFLSGAATLTGCTIEKNESGWLAGGILNNANTTLINCEISQNAADVGGGIYTGGPPLTLINCSIAGNGNGGITGFSTISGPSQLFVKNSVIWGNTGGQILADPGQIPSNWNPFVSFTDIQGGWIGLGNLNLDPLFIQPGCGNLRLAYGSLCINAGNNAYVPPNVTTDLAGNIRIQNGTVDMGAYEGGYDMLPLTACEDNLDDGYTVKLMPTGGAFNPVQVTAAVFTNASGPDNAWVTVTQIDSALHSGAGGFSEMGSILTVDTSLFNGDLYARIYVPIDQSTLNGFDWTSVDLTYFDGKTGDWILAPAANTQNSPGHDGPIGDRIVVQGTNFNTAVTGDLGDYGVFWNPNLQKGFAWANVDHASDFAFGVPLPQCIGDCKFPSDGVVGFTDLTTVLDNWGLAPAGPANFADINRDGVVNVDDLLAVINHWGPCP